tara:strand:- start:1393 stop:1893 length:501 start_codon:yes stop_codon:yes gene_type:complete
MGPQVPLAEDPAYANLHPYEDGILFHGPVFQAITRVIDLSDSTITVECRHAAPESRVMGQFPSDAFSSICLDFLFQSVGLWVHVRDQAAALPAGYDAFDTYVPVPDADTFYITAEIQTKTPHKVVASARLHDADGAIYARATGVDLTISSHLVQKIAAGNPMREAG